MRVLIYGRSHREELLTLAGYLRAYLYEPRFQRTEFFTATERSVDDVIKGHLKGGTSKVAAVVITQKDTKSMEAASFWGSQDGVKVVKLFPEDADYQQKVLAFLGDIKPLLPAIPGLTPDAKVEQTIKNADRPSPGAEDLLNKSDEELREIAKGLGLAIGPNAKTATLIARIVEAREEKQ